MLRFQSASLQCLGASVYRRRLLDQGASSEDLLDSSPVTIIEAVLHTERLRTQLSALVRICGLVESENKGKEMIRGREMLSRLFDQLLEANEDLTPMFR